jgi:phage-related protein
MAGQEQSLSKQLGAFHELMNEKFRSVDQQLALVERQRVEQKSDTKAAVDAALTAQKEAVKEQTTATDKAIEKTEKGTNEQLKQITINFTAGMANLQEVLNDMKDRLVKLESFRIGNSEHRDDNRSSTSIFLSAAFLGVAIIGLAVTIAVGR